MVEDEALHVRERFEMARRVFVVLCVSASKQDGDRWEQFSKPFHAEFFHAAFGLAGNQFRIRGETRFDGLPFIGGQLVPYAEERNGNRYLSRAMI